MLSNDAALRRTPRLAGCTWTPDAWIDEAPETRRSFEARSADQARAEREAAAENSRRERLVETMVEAAERWICDGWGNASPRWLGPELAQCTRFLEALEVCLERDDTPARAFRLLLPLWGAAFSGRARELAGICARVFERWPVGNEPWRAVAAALASTAYLVDHRLDAAIRLATATIDRPDGAALARVAAWRVLAHALHRRGDVETAVSCLQRAEVAAANAGLVAFERDLGALLASALPCSEAERCAGASNPALREAEGPLPRAARWAQLGGDPAALVNTGDVWTISFAGRSTQLRSLKGLEDLATLLARPEQPIHSLELVGGAALAGEPLPALDERARLEYGARLRELEETIEQARLHNDPIPAERAELERDALLQQLTEAFGLGGRCRPGTSAAERARSTVAWRIRSAIQRIHQLHPELGRHLQNAIRTGTWCVYRPEQPVTWQLSA